MAGAAGLFSIGKSAKGQGFPGTPTLAPFVDPLPVPPVHRPVRMERLSPEGYVGPPVDVLKYEVPMTEATHKFHRDLPATRIWGYSGIFPGPTFEVRSGQPIQVRFTNNLPNDHILAYAIDRTLHGAQPGIPDVRTVVHLHGAKVLPDSDGHPDAWYTPGFTQKGPFFTSEENYYPNDQPATMLWYHDHTIGITRLNVMAGLAGLYFVRDAQEDALNLPKGQFEIPLVIQDKTFAQNGAFDYPRVGITSDHYVWNPDYFTDVPVVNGKIRPFVEVEPKKYRFRILNASNSRYFNLHLDTTDTRPFVQIGADEGFLPAPVRMGNLLLAPAERADVIIDFTGLAGKDLVLTNDAKIPFGVPFDFPFPVPPPPSPVVQFRVRQRNSDPDRSVIPDRLPERERLDPANVTVTRDIVMTEKTNVFGAPKVLLLENKMFSEPVSVTPQAGSTEIWRFINGVVGGHPQHIHLAEMEVLDRQPFDTQSFYQTGQVNFLGDRVPAAANELGAPKDTVHVDHASVTRVLAKFDLPSNARVTANQRFQYVHHCHILEHEDNEMMRPFDVIGR